METLQFNGRTHKVFDLETEFGTFKVILVETEYRNNGTLAVEVLSLPGPGEEEEGLSLFATLTVNLDPYTGCDDQDEKSAFLDTNNCPWAKRFVKENRLGTYAGVTRQSGYESYPLYRLRTERFLA